MNRASVTASFSPDKPNPKQIITLKAALEGYLYLAPTLIVLAIFVYLPSHLTVSIRRQAATELRQARH